MITDAIAAFICSSLYDLRLKEVQIEGQICPIIKTGTGCRQLVYNAHRFRTQNTESYKLSDYAKLARLGTRIVWDMDNAPSWICIIEGKIEENPRAKAREMLQIAAGLNPAEMTLKVMQ
jgi:hypothetical protein